MVNIKHIIVATFLLISQAFTSNADAQFVIDNEELKASKDIQDEQASEIAEKIADKWEDENKDIRKSQRKQIINDAKTIYASRFVATPSETDSATILLNLAKIPVGYVELLYNDVCLGYAVVNDGGGIEAVGFNTTSTNFDASTNSEQAIRSQIRKHIVDDGAYIVAGAGLQYKLVYEYKNEVQTIGVMDTVQQEEGLKTVSVDNGTEAALDTVALYNYDFTDGTHHKPLAVIFSIVGTCIVIAIFVIIAV